LEIRIKRSKKNLGFFIGLWIVPIVFLCGCATVSPPSEPTVQTQVIPPEDKAKEALRSAPPEALPPLAELEPMIAAEEIMPFEGKLFSLSTRSAPLQDVLLGLAKEAGLNLVLEKGVDPMEPVSVEVKDLPLKKALKMVLAAYEYFYDIDGNILRIKALETRLFHFDYPLLSNRPETDIGGDVLGGGGGGAGGGGSNLSGEFSVEAEVDEEHLDVWEQIEKALKSGGTGEEGGLLSEMGRAQINRMAGTIVLTDRRENILLVEKYLDTIKESLTRQVMIEAKIIEVALSEGHQFGIDWSYINDRIGNMEGDISIETNLSTGASALNVGWFHSSGGEELSAFLDALATQGNVNVLSAPRLNVLNNQTALISVGRTIPYLQWNLQEVTTAGTGLSSFQAVPDVTQAQAGITLGVTPQIGADRVTTLHIVPIVTDLVDFQTFSFGGAGGGLGVTTFDVPIIDIRETDTIVRVPDNTTIVIGGMIQDRTRDSKTRVPIVGDIPVLGRLFQQQIRDNRKLELVILLTPTVLTQ